MAAKSTRAALVLEQALGYRCFQLDSEMVPGAFDLANPCVELLL